MLEFLKTNSRHEQRRCFLLSSVIYTHTGVLVAWRSQPLKESYNDGSDTCNYVVDYFMYTNHNFCLGSR